MKHKAWAILFLLLFLPGLLAADKVKKAFHQLQKQKFAKAASLLSKTLHKDSANAGAQYVYALYYSDAANPAAHADSAYQYVLRALSNYPKTKAKTIKQWKKVGISDSTMTVLKVRLDSVAFVNALEANQVAVFQLFIDKYPTAQQKREAIRLRNALAFAEARRVNTYESYQQFFKTYPEAEEAKKATEVFELLLFESATKDGTIDSYARFADQYPQSPYREQADWTVFSFSTAFHTAKQYHNFIEKYPRNSYVPRAWAWLFYFQSEEGQLARFLVDFPNYPDKMDAQRKQTAEPLTFFPVYEEEKYGFLDATGQLQVPIVYDSTASDYFCDGVKEDFMVVFRHGKAGAVDKTGRVVVDFAYDAIEELEKPLLRVVKDNKQGVMHEGGFEILPAVFDAVDVLNDYFIKVTQNGKQGLYTINGRPIGEVASDSIDLVGTEFIRFRQRGKYALQTNESLLAISNARAKPTFRFLYQNVQVARPGYVQVQTDSLTTVVMDSRLQTVLSTKNSQVSTLSNAWVTRDSVGYQLWSLDGKPLADSSLRGPNGEWPHYQKVVANEQYYGVKYQQRWGIVDQQGKLYQPLESDSVVLLPGSTFILLKEHAAFLHTSTRSLVRLGELGSPALVKNAAMSGDALLVMKNKSGKQALYSLQGKQLLPPWYDQIEIVNPRLYIIEANGKFGLKDSLNKLLLPMVYDGLSSWQKGYFALLKDRKFGLLHLTNKVNIAPQYEAVIQFYDYEEQLFIARKNGKYGLIDRSNKEKAPFRFDEIRFWQKSIALVKEGDEWRLFDFSGNFYFLAPFEEIAYIRNEPEEIVLKVYAHQQYGILSNRQGQLISMEYEGLSNAGTPQVPFYIAEKFVDTASVYLLFYFDGRGKLLRRQLFDETLYQKIGCE